MRLLFVSCSWNFLMSLMFHVSMDKTIFTDHFIGHSWSDDVLDVRFCLRAYIRNYSIESGCHGNEPFITSSSSLSLSAIATTVCPQLILIALAWIHIRSLFHSRKRCTAILATPTKVDKPGALASKSSYREVIETFSELNVAHLPWHAFRASLLFESYQMR